MNGDGPARYVSDLQVEISATMTSPELRRKGARNVAINVGLPRHPKGKETGSIGYHVERGGLR